MPLKKQFTYIAFFDLDETILSVNSANYLVKESRKRGMMTKRQFRQAVRYSLLYKFKLSKATRISSLNDSGLKPNDYANNNQQITAKIF